MVDEVIDKFLKKFNDETLSNKDEATSISDPLLAKYAGDIKPEPKKVETTSNGFLKSNENLMAGVAKGVVNVGNTLSLAHANITQGVERLFKTNNRDRVGQTKENIDRVNKLYNEQYGDSKMASVGSILGEVGATLPFTPGRVMQGIKTAAGAMPTILSTGEKVAAPMANRLGAAAGQGAVGGAIYGAGTVAGSDSSLAGNVGINALGGAVAGPVLAGAGQLASKVIPAIRSFFGNSAINVFANKYGITPNSAKRVIAELENEGMTLAEAEAQIAMLGKDATIGDLTPGLQKFVGALAQRGGRATAIVENRYAQRAKMADDQARTIMETKLGPKPDLKAEEKAIIDKAYELTGADYTAAKASDAKLSVYSLIGDINTKLETAVGAKANALKEAKGFLYKTAKDAEGNEVKSIKTSVKDLHEVRIGLDDMIERMESPTTTQGSRALSAIKDVRKAVDVQLKTVPEMAAADAKFAEKMKIKDGLEFGYEALKKGNIEEFNKAFNAASPELKDTMRKGLRAAIGDEMERAANGELAGAQQMFKKRTVTREKLKTAFGSDGEEVLEALATQAVLRRTEKMASEGSRTAANLRINALMDKDGKSSGVLSEIVKGGAIDLSTGAPAAAAIVMGAKRLGGNIVNKVGEVRKDANIESFADIVSRSGKDLTNAMKVISRVTKIQDKIIGKDHPDIKLPITLSGPVGEYGIEKGKKAINKLGEYLP